MTFKAEEKGIYSNPSFGNKLLPNFFNFSWEESSGMIKHKGLLSGGESPVGILQCVSRAAPFPSQTATCHCPPQISCFFSGKIAWWQSNPE